MQKEISFFFSFLSDSVFGKAKVTKLLRKNAPFEDFSMMAAAQADSNSTLTGRLHQVQEYLDSAAISPSAPPEPGTGSISG